MFFSFTNFFVWSDFYLKSDVSKKDQKIDHENSEVKILSKKTGKVLIFSDVSFDIWLLLNKTISFENLIEEMLSQYEIDEKTLKKDINKFLNELKRHQLIKYSRSDFS